jgi:hypothetical protein
MIAPLLTLAFAVHEYSSLKKVLVTQVRNVTLLSPPARTRA